MFRELSLQKKIMILISCITILMMSIVICFDTFMLERTVKNTSMSQLQGMATAINGMYEESHSIEDVQQIFDYIQKENRNVLELVMYGEDVVEAATNRELIGSPSPSDLLDRVRNGQFEVEYIQVGDDDIPKARLTSSLKEEGETIGAIEMTLDVSSNVLLIQKRINMAIFVGLLVTILLMSLLSLGIRHLVITPLHRIREVAQNVQQGRLDQSLNLTSSTEFRDVTEAFNEMVFKLKQRYKELQEALQTLRNTQKQLVESEKMVALGSLVAGVSHEINTPLGIGVTASSYLGEKTKTILELYENQKLKRSDLENYLKNMQETSSIIETNLTRASELVKSFKQVAVDRSNEGRRTFWIKAYLEDVLVSLSPRLKKTRHRITIEGDDDLQIHSDPGAISQVFTNLIMNSLIHAFREDEQGEIKILLQRNHDHLNILYSDNGKGMVPNVMERIFDPFFTTNRGGGGTGLGMHIVYNLVTQSLDGIIQCESTPGVGTKFTISIPINGEGGREEDD